ncbi:MAG: polyamine aminopropyltransferase [Saccharospirillaceae bacterium]|nr:polyamine aminopropyltransferase [Pseudomonadales bacterium]NRB79515.1 polyamine aminopropyltransferase [Saccharospirillaceae bacterium]
MSSTAKRPHLIINDIIIISIMAVLAGCGLIYEYLLSHYAGRILGSMESAIYSIIGIMIVSMGCGSFYARRFKDSYKTFAWLEVTVALLGATTVLIISALIGYSHELPQVLSEHYGIEVTVLFSEGLTSVLYKISMTLPYVFGFLLGFLIGMEIPLIARIREHYYEKHIEHNTGTIYGADYIGAGVGAALWVLLMLKLEINQAAAITASLNLVAGLVFILRFKSRITGFKKLIFAHVVLAFMIVVIFYFGGNWHDRMQNMLYQNEVVYQQHTEHQNLVFTEHFISQEKGSVIDFYINGNLQFSSMDEYIYHEMLVHPAFLVAARTEHVLVIGGGDGLALREILKWKPKSVTLVDLDKELLELFQTPEIYMPKSLAENISELTQQSLSHEVVTLINQDAFIYSKKLLKNNNRFDVIVVDLPDPSHPDLNKLYTQEFYKTLKELLMSDGVMVVQSNSPYHAKSVFVSIGKTLKSAGFNSVQQYQQNVPTFGQWGWSIALPKANSAKQKIKQSEHQLPQVQWVTKSLIDASFEFPVHFYRNYADIKINRLNSLNIYQYFQQAWSVEGGYSLD